MRDLILKKTPKDFDIITSAELKEVIFLFDVIITSMPIFKVFDFGLFGHLINCYILFLVWYFCKNWSILSCFYFSWHWDQYDNMASVVSYQVLHFYVIH